MLLFTFVQEVAIGVTTASGSGDAGFSPEQAAFTRTAALVSHHNAFMTTQFHQFFVVLTMCTPSHRNFLGRV